MATLSLSRSGKTGLGLQWAWFTVVLKAVVLKAVVLKSGLESSSFESSSFESSLMRNCQNKIGFVSVFFLCLFAITANANADDLQKQIKPFFDAHCIDCHSGAESEGGLDLAKLSDNLQNEELLRKWIVIHDRIKKGEMPPPEDATLPAGDQSKVVAMLAKNLHRADLARNDVVLRRLNQTEYENTVRDLFDVTVRVKELLPKDASAAGFDNVGESLAVSAEAMQAYLRAADLVLDAAFGPVKKPKHVKVTTNLRQQLDYTGKKNSMARFLGTMFRETEAGIVIFHSGYCPTAIREFKAPAPGIYRGTFRVRAIQSDQPVTLRIYGGDVVASRNERHLVGYYDLPPNQWKIITFEDELLNKNGTFLPKCFGTFGMRKDADTFTGAGIELGDITLEGPLNAWPPRSRAKIMGSVDSKNGTLADAKRIIKKFLPIAFRRTTSPQEEDVYVKLIEATLKQGRTFEEAIRLGLKAVICSPEFLFLEEPGQKTISQFAVASRLSYFLWSSMPDAELLELAKKGKLNNSRALRQQVERMLKDPKANALTHNFTGQWLNLRDIDFTQPDKKLYPEFDELLKLSMIQETHLFFQEVLNQNLSVMNFVDSDFTFLNARLAKHYGIEGVTGQEFQKVRLPKDSVRGGLLTQASVLKVTANGTNTSPVIRGIWVLDNILGLPPPPPPSNVSAVEPDIRGAVTLREQLAKHRDVESCAICHRSIDPAGFALENFDVIGGWRDNYRTLGGKGKRSNIMLNPFAHVRSLYRIGLPSMPVA